MPTLPRYFVPRAGTAKPVPVGDAAHVLDVFRLAAPAAGEREWIVATDGLGGLLAQPEGEPELPAGVRAELADHEVSGSRRTRRIEAAQLYLFNPQLLEQPVQAPGLDDPVYLYGTLFGPYPATVPSAPGVEGQLTVTRADLLEGFVRGAAHAFRYPSATAGGPPRRCFHLLLPGGREEAIAQGEGLVLTYPLLPPELFLHDLGNELVVAQLLYDVLAALREDLGRERIAHPLRDLTLPVPSRHVLEQQLAAEGYEIRGDTAVKKTPAGPGFRGLLASAFGALMQEALDLPPEGEVEDYLRISAEALAKLPGFPSSRTTVLRRRTGDAQLSPTRPVLVNRTPAAPAPPPPPAPPTPRPVLPPTEPAEWMRDFMSGHQAPGTPAPRVSAPAAWKPEPSPKPRAGVSSRPDWMQDFKPAPGAGPSRTEPAKPVKRDEEKPDWMKDFE